MEQSILTRRCPRCKQDKLLETEFHRDLTNASRYQGTCKECRSKYNKNYAMTEIGKASRLASRKSLIGVVARRNYNKDYFNRQEVKQARKEYRRINSRTHCRGPEEVTKKRARNALAKAVLSGVIKRPAKCSSCGSNCRPQAHHYLGYVREHWLDVRWLCRDCHTLEHYPLPADGSSPVISLRNN